MSFSGCSAITRPADCDPSAKVSRISDALATTWRLVRMSPPVSTTTPLPSPLLPEPASSGYVVSMRTSDGRTDSYASWERGGPEVCEARACATRLSTSRCVSGAGPRTKTA